MDGGLPYVDTHTISVALEPDELWGRLRASAARIGVGPKNPIAVLLGTDPRPGFAIVEEVPGERITLAGRHRFSRYRLVFEIEPRPLERTSLLHARTYAEFPGAAGRAYRALVIGSGLHVLATRQLLRRMTKQRP